MGTLITEVARLLGRVFFFLKPGPTGAVAVYRSLRTRKVGSEQVEWIVGNATWLVILTVLAMQALSHLLRRAIPLQPGPVFWWIFLYAVYSLALKRVSWRFPTRYDTPVFRWVRIQVNIIMLSVLIGVTSGIQSPYWIFYSLPLFAAAIYSRNWIRPAAAGLEVFAFYSIASWHVAAGSGEALNWLIIVFNTAAIVFVTTVLYQMFRLVREHSYIDHFEAINFVQDLANTVDPVANLERLMDDVIECAVKAARAERGSLMLLDRKTGTLRIESFYPPRKVEDHHQFKLGEGIAGWVAQSQHAYLSSDAAQDPRFVPPMLEGSISSILVVPIVSRGRTVGVISVDSPKVGHFDKGDMYTLLTFASLIGDKIEWAKALRSLRSLRETVFSDLTTILDTILDQLEEVLGYDSAAIFLVTDGKAHVDAARGHPDPKIAHGVSISLSDPLFAEMSRTRQPVVLHDAQQDERFAGLGGTDYVRGWLGAPLIARGEIVGCITLDSEKEGAFTEADGQLVSIFAAHAALAIQDAQLFRQLETLYDAIQVIVSDVDLEELAARVVELIRRISHVQASCILLFDETTETLVYHSVSLNGHQRFPTELKLRVGQGIPGWVAKRRRPEVVPDVRRDPRWDPRFDQFTGFESREVLAAPMVAKGHLIGVIELVNKAQGRFTVHDEMLLESIAASVAIAFQNNHLFKQTRRRAVTLETLAKASTEISRRLPTPELPESIVAGATELVEAKGGAIYLLERQGHFTLKVAYGLGKEVEGITFSIGDSATGQALRAREPVVIDDYRNWPHRLSFLDKYNLTAVLAVPLYWGEQPLGAIAVHDTVEGRKFEQEEVEALGAFAEQAASIIKHSQDLSELARQKEYLENLVSTALDGIIGVDQRGQVLMYNPSARRLLEYSEREVHQMNWSQFFASRKEARDVQRRIIKDGYVKDHFTHAKSKSQEPIPVLLSAFRLPNGAVAFFRDIRKIQRAQAELALTRGLLLAITDAGPQTDLRRVLKQFVANTREVLGCGSVILYLYDDVQGNLQVPPIESGVKNPAFLTGPVARDSIPFELLNQQDPCFIEDVHLHPLTEGSQFVDREGTRALAGCPLRSGATPIGVLLCNYGEPHTFSREEESLIDSFATLSAIAMERARQYENNERQARQLVALDKATETIKSYENLEEALDPVLEVTEQATACQKVAFFKYDRDRNELNLTVHRGLSAEYVQRSQGLPVKRDSRTAVVLEDTPIMVGDIHVSERFGHYAEMADKEGYRAFVDIRLQGKSGPVGALTAYYEEPRIFTPTDEKFFRTFASTIESAWLAKEVEQLAQTLEILGELQEFLEVGQTNEDQLLQKATRLVHEMFRYEMIGVGLRVGNQLVFQAKATYGFEDKVPDVLTQSVYEGLAGLAVTSGEPVWTIDVIQDTRCKYNPPNARSELVVPLKAGGEVLGVLDVYSSQVGAFNEANARLLEVVGSQVALALKFVRTLNNLREAEEREKVHFISSWGAYIAHELRSLAGTLPKALETLEEIHQVGDVLDEESRQLLATTKTSARNVITLANEFYKGAEAGPPESVQVQAILAEAIELANLPPSITTHVSVPSELLYVSAVPSILKEVFIHIVRNASEHGLPHGGTLSVQARLNNGGRRVKIEFADTGRGMSDSVKRRVFRPRFNPKSKKHLGISLYFDRLHVRMWGGNIDFDWERTQPKKGTVFIVSLVVTQAPVEPVLQPALRKPSLPRADLPRGSGKVLVVDDLANWRSLLSKLLKARGYQVLAARSPRMARAYAARTKIDLAILDVNLGGPDEKDGVHLAESLHRQDPDIKIILYTAYPIPPEAVDLRRQGVVVDILAKGPDTGLDIDAFETIFDATLAEASSREGVD